MDPIKLSDQIREHFNDSELRDLCFRLQIDYENLAGQTRQDKVRELTMHCQRHGLTAELLELCRQLRPRLDWATVNRSDGTTPPQGQVGNTPGPLPQTAAPQMPGMFWMAYPNVWYGPFNGYYIQWMSFGGFQVWHPMAGFIPYPDPYHQFQRNVWVRLINSPFNIYVDATFNGYVFGQFSPF